MNDIFKNNFEFVSTIEDAGFSIKKRKVSSRDSIKYVLMKKKVGQVNSLEVETLLSKEPFCGVVTVQKYIPNVNSYRWVYKILDDECSVAFFGFNLENSPGMSEPIQRLEYIYEESIDFLQETEEVTFGYDIVQSALNVIRLLSISRVVEFYTFQPFLIAHALIASMYERNEKERHEIYETLNNGTKKMNVGHNSKTYIQDMKMMMSGIGMGADYVRVVVPTLQRKFS